jgi:protein MpaA
MSFLFGKSVNGLAISGHRFGFQSETSQKKKHMLVLGGVHGDEVEGVVLANALLAALLQNDSIDFQMTLVPSFNIDGVLAKTRGNANGVDLNRNLPTKDWSPEATTPRYQPGPSPLSEAENKALVEFIDNEKPNFILSLHSWKPLLNINDPEGSSVCRQVATAISSLTGDVIEPTIGYSTPGCLGTYAGFERGIPTLTYEIERGLSPKAVIEKHLAACFDGFKKFASIY